MKADQAVTKTVGGQTVGNVPLHCETAGASDYCMHCGRYVTDLSPCYALEKLRLVRVADEDVVAWGCCDEAMDPSEGRCEKWCHRTHCPVTLRSAALEAAALLQPQGSDEVVVKALAWVDMLSDDFAGSSIGEATSPIGASPPLVSEVTEALRELVLCMDLFQASDGNQSDAYYLLAKQDSIWARARAALATPKEGIR